jgi:hypothetical protein
MITRTARLPPKRAHRGKRIETTCELRTCARFFLARADQRKIGRGRFCSPGCVRLWRIEQCAIERERLVGHPHTVKRCGKCQVIKPVAEFYPALNQGKHRRHGYCKECCRLYSRERGSKDVLKYKARDPLYYRRKKLLKLYGITHEQYMDMHGAQSGVCAMCGGHEKRILYGSVAHLVVDHDHKTGKVRGLLCCRCNGALGSIENADLLQKGLAYLRTHA